MRMLLVPVYLAHRTLLRLGPGDAFGRLVSLTYGQRSELLLLYLVSVLFPCVLRHICCIAAKESIRRCTHALLCTTSGILS